VQSGTGSHVLVGSGSGIFEEVGIGDDLPVAVGVLVGGEILVPVGSITPGVNGTHVLNDCGVESNVGGLTTGGPSAQEGEFGVAEINGVITGWNGGISPLCTRFAKNATIAAMNPAISEMIFNCFRRPLVRGPRDSGSGAGGGGAAN
jgi:hypothetical protein